MELSKNKNRRRERDLEEWLYSGEVNEEAETKTETKIIKLTNTKATNLQINNQNPQIFKSRNSQT